MARLVWLQHGRQMATCDRSWLQLSIVIAFLVIGCGNDHEGRGDDAFDGNRSPAAPELSLKMVWIEPGSFKMGSHIRQHRERLHRIVLSRGFWMSTTEVPQSLYVAVMGDNPSHFKGDDLPVERVSWEDAVEFCSQLTAREHANGRLPPQEVYRLPSEAEWEYACRAGSTTAYCFGDDAKELEEYGNFDTTPKDYSDDGTACLAQLKPNAWGLYDMHGNVGEWCLDWYSPDYRVLEQRDPIGPSEGDFRVIRGGSWALFADSCESAARYWDLPSHRSYDVGFRIVKKRVPAHNVHGRKQEQE